MHCPIYPVDMRRLRVAILTSGLLLVSSGLALAGPSRSVGAGRSVGASARAAGRVARVPRGVRRISVSLTVPFANGPGAHAPVRRTLTRPATVTSVVAATDALPPVRVMHPCPLLLVRGPELALVYRGAHGAALATLMVQVTLGSAGHSGSSPCFPIRFSRSGHERLLLGNGFVRMVGRLLGTPIS